MNNVLKSLTKHIFNWNRPRGVRYLFKELSITSVLIVVGACGCCYILFQLDWGLCGNEIFQEIYSPDSEYKVVVFQRDCGATTGFSTQISILKASEELPNKKGNIFIMDGHPDWTEVQVVWDSNREITIDYLLVYGVSAKDEKHRDFLETFTINYRN